MSIAANHVPAARRSDCSAALGRARQNSELQQEILSFTPNAATRGKSEYKLQS